MFEQTWGLLCKQKLDGVGDWSTCKASIGVHRDKQDAKGDTITPILSKITKPSLFHLP